MLRIRVRSKSLYIYIKTIKELKNVTLRYIDVVQYCHSRYDACSYNYLVTMMKLQEQLEELREQLIDQDAQIKQLRADLQQVNKALGVVREREMGEKHKQEKAVAIELGKEVHKLLKKYPDHPYVKDRDVFTTKHMFELITSGLEDTESRYGLVRGYCVDYFKTKGKGAAQLRRMCHLLELSGMFKKLKGQISRAGSVEYGYKRSTQKLTLIAVRDFERYENLGSCVLGRMAGEQEYAANVLYHKLEASHKEVVASTELAEEPSFL